MGLFDKLKASSPVAAVQGLFGGGGAASPIAAMANPFTSFGGLAGNKEDAGLLGLGQYKATGYNIDPSAFTNMPGIDSRAAELAEAYAKSQARGAPQATAATIDPAAQAAVERYAGATIDPTQQAEFRAREMGLADQLTAAANGQGPSLAQNQLRDGADQAIAQAMALQASGRGSNAGAGMRNAALAQSSIGGQAARDAANLRAQEQITARQQLAGVLAQGRGADIGLATNQAGLTQQAGLAGMNAQNVANLNNAQSLNQRAMAQAQFAQQMALANQDASLKQTGMNDQMSQFFHQNLIGLDVQKAKALQDLQALQSQQSVGLAKANADAYAAASKARAGAWGGLGSALSSGGGLFGGLFGGGGAGGGAGGGGGGNGQASPGEGTFDSSSSSPDSSTNYSPYGGGGAAPDNYVEQSSQNPQPTDGGFLWMR